MPLNTILRVSFFGPIKYSEILICSRLVLLDFFINLNYIQSSMVTLQRKICFFLAETSVAGA